MTPQNTIPDRAELTSKQIKAGWEKTFSTNNPFCPCDLKSFTKAVNWAERVLAARSLAVSQPEPLKAAPDAVSEFDIAAVMNQLSASPSSVAAFKRILSTTQQAAKSAATRNRYRAEIAPDRDDVFAEPVAPAAAHSAAPAAVEAIGEPVAWVSPEQLDAHPDGGHDGSGRYLPIRKSMAGKFTMPLFAPSATSSSQDAPRAVPAGLGLLAKKHEGMRVDYSGLLGQCQRALGNRGESANAEMLRQLKDHLQELGRRWYAGDTAVVDEILQLYCIEKDARAALAASAPGAKGEK